MIKDVKAINRALISVSNKDGIVDIARELANQNIEIISTGGTFKLLQDNGIQAMDVSSITGFPEIMDGRVKTLHPKIHGGLLAKRADKSHRQAMTDHGIDNIDLLIVNLYPFHSTVLSGADEETCIENIDIGGPAMIRAAAKNFQDVCVVTDAQDYLTLAEHLKSQQGTDISFRRHMSAKAFTHTAHYDTAVSTWFKTGAVDHPFTADIEEVREMRYGENPHQSAKYFITSNSGCTLARSEQVQGKQLSFNNINDSSAALDLVIDLMAFNKPGAAIIKHANPCGVAIADTQIEAYNLALRTDTVSAFGGIIAVNSDLGVELAGAITSTFVEVIIAPSASKEALQICASKPNMRVLLTGEMNRNTPDVAHEAFDIRSVSGGFLLQQPDSQTVFDADLKLVTKQEPSQQQIEDLKLAAIIAKHVKSNAIVYVRDGASSGIGAGQMSRVDSARIAAIKAQEAAMTAGLDNSLTVGAVAASDAFFPFADGLEEIAKAGAVGVIQPGGSIRDDEVIQAANEANLAMVFTGTRHFRH